VSHPFTVIGGHLGACKSTLLDHPLADAHGFRLPVLLNDIGSVNIDASLIRGQDGQTIEHANGGMCCTLVGGFAQCGRMYGLPLDGILVDAERVRAQSADKDVGDTILRQFGQTDLILLNKTALAPGARPAGPPVTTDS
jgi:hypothetical protein